MTCWFVDFWPGFNPYDNYFINQIKELYSNIKVEPNNPDILFCSIFGSEHFNYNCIKIYYTGENDVPDFNLYDYAISFHHINFEDRYLRLPLYVLYKDYKKIDNKKIITRELSKRKFCNFVYSNSKIADPIREYFFHELSKYKKVDSGGRYLNNIGGPIENKIDFIKNYKFTISFENSSLSGYTTEKIMEPMTVNSLPIYWGNPSVSYDFNPESFIQIKNRNDIDVAIQKIIELDTNDELYLNKLSTPWLNNNNLTPYLWNEKFKTFIKDIIDKKEKRITEYGYVKNIQKKTKEFKRYQSYILKLKQIFKFKI